jgi:hypothetical protein
MSAKFIVEFGHLDTHVFVKLSATYWTAMFIEQLRGTTHKWLELSA